MRQARTLFIASAIVACLAGALLRLPAMMQPLGIDQGIFSAAAFGMSQGGALYRDLWDQKPPGIHLIYRAGFALIGWQERTVFWMDYAAFAATILLIALVGRRLVDAAWGWGAAAVYAVLGLPPIRFGHGGFLERAVPETFIPLCALAAAACVLNPIALAPISAYARQPQPRPQPQPQAGAEADPRSETRDASRWQTRVDAVLAGVCIGCAALLKPTALIYWPMLLIAGPIIAPRLRRWRGREAVWSMIGVGAPIAICVLWLWSRHALDDAYAAIVEYNRAYLAVGYEPRAFVNRFVHEVWRLTKTDPLWLLGIGGLVLGAIGWVRAPVHAWRRFAADHGADGAAAGADRAVLLGIAWLGAALIAAAANGARFYSTYFMPCLVPLALLASTLLFSYWHWHDRVRRLIVLVLIATAAVRSVQTAVPQRLIDTIGEDLHQMRVSGDRAARLHYLEGFGSYASGRGYSARANDELSAWIDAHSDPADRIFIFGMAPSVYFTSRRLPAQRFLWIGPAASNLIPRPDFSLEAVAADLERAQPRYIVEEHNNRDSLLGWRVEDKFNDPSMRQVLTAYEPVVQIEDFSIYRRR